MAFTHCSFRAWKRGFRKLVSCAYFTGLCSVYANPAPVQTFYLPVPEDDLLQVLQTIEGGATWISAADKPQEPMYVYVNIAVFADDTILYVDQWENGYDPDISNPLNLYHPSTNLGGTQIWGDNDPVNGFPPGITNDLLDAGTVITLFNAIQTTNRLEITFDAGDKIAATKPVAVTWSAWASGSATLLAGANEVYDTSFFGTEFLVPVGEDIPDSEDFQAFEYTGMSVMAGPNGATVEVDTNADGVFDLTNVLAQGEAFTISGNPILDCAFCGKDGIT